MLMNSQRYLAKRGWVITTGLILAVSFFSVGCSKTTDVEHVNRAEVFVKDRDYRSAIIEYKNALSVNKENLEARFALGSLYARTGDIASARKELLVAYSKGYRQDEARAILAKILVSGQKYSDAIDEVSAVPAQDAAVTAKIYTYLGLAHLGNREKERGVSLLKKAISVDPQSADAVYGQAYLAFLNKNYSGAQKFLERAIVLDPSLLDARLLHADIDFLLSKFKKSEKEYALVMEQEPKNLLTLYSLRANLGLIQSLVAQNKLNAAKEQVNYALSKSPSNSMLFYFSGMIAYQEKEYDVAEKSLLKVINSIPGHMPSLFLLGAINFQQNELEQAGEYLGTYLARDQNNVQARKMLAAIRMRLRQPELAMEVLEPVLDKADQDIGLLSLIGSVAVRSGAQEVGTEYLKKAVSSTPDNAALRTELALAYLVESDFSPAIEELKIAAEKGLGDAGKKANLLLVLTYLKSKNSDAALAEAKKFLLENPEDPTAHNLLGIVYGQLGRESLAKSSFDAALQLNSKYTPAAVNLARLAQAGGNLGDAKKRYESILSYEPKNTSVMMALARVSQKLGNIDDSIRWLTEAANASDEALSPRVMLAHYYLQRRDLVQAKKYVNGAKAISQDSPDVLVIEGLLAKAEGEFTKAIKFFQQLLAVQPGSLIGLYQSGVIYSALGKLDLAENMLTKALSVNRKHMQAISLLARIKMRRGELREAQVLVDEVKLEHSKTYGAYVLEADLLYAKRRYADAISLYKKANALRETDALVLKIAKSYRLSGERGIAKKFLEGWLEKKPEDYQIRLVLAGEQELQGDTIAALENYEVLLSHNSSDPLVLNNIAWLYFEQGNPKAREYAEKAYSIAPRAPSVLDTLGWILANDGEPERAVQLLRKASNLAPAVPDIKYHLAISLVKLGEDEQAKALLESLLKSPKGLSVDTVELRKILKNL